jgi:zinc/manganese transport system substrate-binding protein
MRRSISISAVVLGALMVGGCQTNSATSSSGQLHVVAAENFWGVLARDLGGAHVAVTSLLTNPNADPHDVTASSADARAVAGANLLIANGAGYDSWFISMVHAAFGGLPDNGTTSTIVAAGTVKGGQNPHVWYDLATVRSVAHEITSHYIALDPKDRPDFLAAARSVNASLVTLDSQATAIRSAFPVARIASTESIAVPLAGSLGLTLISPPAFMEAVAEGTDPPIPSVITFEQQLRSGTVNLLVINAQTQTPITTTMANLARSLRIPVVSITETVQPPNAPYATWMGGEYAAIARALATTR